MDGEAHTGSGCHALVTDDGRNVDCPNPSYFGCGPGQYRRGARRLFQSVLAYHAFACNRIGPRLDGVFGRTAGSLPDFPNFSDALKKSGIVWNAEKLVQFLADPRAMVPGTSMWVGKVDDAQKRRDVIAFLQQPDTSLDLCPG